MDNPFPVRLRVASIVPRWSIVHHLKPDYLSSHSFFVSIYAFQIAGLIGWQGDRGHLLWSALTHDLDELITGDIVGPVKREIIDARKTSDFIGRKMMELMPGLNIKPWMGDDCHLIVKAADQLDALLWAIGEQVLGNGIIASRIPSCKKKFEEAWYALPGLAEDQLLELWEDVVTPAVWNHQDLNMYDIEAPK